MSRRLFRYLSALLMLVLYVTVLVGGDVAALTCECRYHHKADVHTDFKHIHKCADGCCSHHAEHCAEHCAEQHTSEYNASALDEACTCQHDHSTEVVLYTYPRLDDGSVRQTILLAVLTNVEIVLEPSPVFTSYDYSADCHCALHAGYVGNSALRAPPQLV